MAQSAMKWSSLLNARDIIPDIVVALEPHLIRFFPEGMPP